jgi:hypothetical protein
VDGSIIFVNNTTPEFETPNLCRSPRSNRQATVGAVRGVKRLCAVYAALVSWLVPCSNGQTENDGKKA